MTGLLDAQATDGINPHTRVKMKAAAPVPKQGNSFIRKVEASVIPSRYPSLLSFFSFRKISRRLYI